MKNKLIVLSTIFVVIISYFVMANNSATAYSNDNYSIDVPSDYKSSGSNMWVKSNGDNFNIQVKSHNGSKIKGSLDKALKELLDETVKLDIYSSVETKEVSKFTKNNYKGMHIIAKLKTFNTYAEQYAFISDENTYVVTFSSKSKDYFSSDEVKNIIKSFTIPNYKEPKKSLFSNNILRGAIVGAIIGACVAGVTAVKNKKNKSNTTNEQNKEE